MYHYFLIDSSVNGHLGCFHVPKVKAAQSCPTLCNPMDYIQSVSSVTQSCPTLCDPMPARQASLSSTNSRSPPQPMSIESVMPSNQLILCRPLLLLPSIFPSIRVFSNESAFCIRWQKFWTFSFNMSPSNEYSGLISFRMGCRGHTYIYLIHIDVWQKPTQYSIVRQLSSS